MWKNILKGSSRRTEVLAELNSRYAKCLRTLAEGVTALDGEKSGCEASQLEDKTEESVE